jgi:hypothetical protein
MARFIEKTMSLRIAIIGILCLALPGFSWIDTELDDSDPALEDQTRETDQA